MSTNDIGPAPSQEARPDADDSQETTTRPRPTPVKSGGLRAVSVVLNSQLGRRSSRLALAVISSARLLDEAIDDAIAENKDEALYHKVLALLDRFARLRHRAHARPDRDVVLEVLEAACRRVVAEVMTWSVERTEVATLLMTEIACEAALRRFGCDEPGCSCLPSGVTPRLVLDFRHRAVVSTLAFLADKGCDCQPEVTQ